MSSHMFFLLTNHLARQVRRSGCCCKKAHKAEKCDSLSDAKAASKTLYKKLLRLLKRALSDRGLMALTHQQKSAIGQSGEVSDSSLFGVFRAVVRRTGRLSSFWPI